MAGAPQSTIDVCESDQKAAAGLPPSAKCANDCEVTRAQCQTRCPLTGFSSCYECSAACGLTAAQCTAACPRELAHCTDGKRDDGETDVDCGGPCGPCAEGLDCQVNSDCISDNCLGGSVCAPIVPCAMPGDCSSGACLFGTCR